MEKRSKKADENQTNIQGIRSEDPALTCTGDGDKDGVIEIVLMGIEELLVVLTDDGE